MNYFKLISSITLLSFSISISAQSNHQVTWHEPENFSDIKETTESPKKFQKRLFAKLEKHIAELSVELFPEYSFAMTVSDLDLAGHVYPGYTSGFDNPQDMRVVERIHFPRIEFSYNLKDQAGIVIKQGEVSLKDMNFLDRIQKVRARRDGLHHEKEMLNKWFKKLSKEMAKSS